MNSSMEALAIASVLTNLLTILINLVVVVVNLKIYTEFFKERVKGK